MAETIVNIDVIDMSIPLGNDRNIAVINQPNPCYGYPANAGEVRKLMQLPYYYIYVAGTDIIINPYNFYEYFPRSGGGGGGGGGTGDKSRYTITKYTSNTGEVSYKLMQSINSGGETVAGDVISIRGTEMLVTYGNELMILDTALVDIKDKIDATYNFTTFTELEIDTHNKTLKQITDELHAKNLPSNTVVTGQLYTDALPFSGNGEAEVMINAPAYWWKCTSLNVAPYSWTAIAGGGSWSGVIVDWTPTTATSVKLTGYSVDSSETPITSSKTIEEAIEQLDYRTTTNKTDISLVTNHIKFSANSKTYYLQPEQPANPQDGDIWIG